MATTIVETRSTYNSALLCSIYTKVDQNMIGGSSGLIRSGWLMRVSSYYGECIERCRDTVTYLANHEYDRTEVPQCTRWEDDIGMCVFRSSLNDALAGFGETCLRSGPSAGPHAMQKRCASRPSLGQLVTNCSITFTMKASSYVRACLRIIQL